MCAMAVIELTLKRLLYLFKPDPPNQLSMHFDDGHLNGNNGQSASEFMSDSNDMEEKEEESVHAEEDTDGGHLEAESPLNQLGRNNGDATCSPVSDKRNRYGCREGRSYHEDREPGRARYDLHSRSLRTASLPDRGKRHHRDELDSSSDDRQYTNYRRQVLYSESDCRSTGDSKHNWCSRHGQMKSGRLVRLGMSEVVNPPIWAQSTLTDRFATKKLTFAELNFEFQMSITCTI